MGAPLNFPASPTPGQKYPVSPPAGVPIYTWDGEKWTTIGGAIGTGGAPIQDPAFIGNPTAPTPAPGDNDTSLATTAFVKNAVDTAIAALAATIPAVASVAEFRANSAPAKVPSLGTIWGAPGLVAMSDATGTITPDFSQGIDFYCSVAGAGRTLGNPVNGKQGQKGLLIMIGGSITAWGNAYLFPNGAKPTSSGGWDIYSYYFWDNTHVFVSVGTGFA